MDHMLWHNAVNLNHASIPFLKGKSSADPGLFQVLLMRELVSTHLVAWFSDVKEPDSSERQNTAAQAIGASGAIGAKGVSVFVAVFVPKVLHGS